MLNVLYQDMLRSGLSWGTKPAPTPVLWTHPAEEENQIAIISLQKSIRVNNLVFFLNSNLTIWLEFLYFVAKSLGVKQTPAFFWDKCSVGPYQQLIFHLKRDTGTQERVQKLETVMMVDYSTVSHMQQLGSGRSLTWKREGHGILDCHLITCEGLLFMGECSWHGQYCSE